jgi:hypothetical protein
MYEIPHYYMSREVRNSLRRKFFGPPNYNTPTPFLEPIITPTTTLPERPSPLSNKRTLSKRNWISETTGLISLTFSQQQTALPGDSKKRGSTTVRNH